jgi:hypothetical protein
MRLLKWLIPLLGFGLLAYWIATSCDNWVVTEARLVPSRSPSELRLSVLNASGVIGAARDVREWLTRQGFDVYDHKDNDEIVPRTQIIDRVDRQMLFARDVRGFLTVPARRLGPFVVSPRRQPEIACRLDSLLFLDVTVLLGSDFRQFCPVAARPF